MQEISSDQFDGLLSSSDTPLVLDIWAPWCGPCSFMAPVLEDLSEEYAGFVRFAKSNVDDNPQLARRFNVMSIPTLLVFDGGKVVGSIVGAAPAETIREKISEVLGVG